MAVDTHPCMQVMASSHVTACARSLLPTNAGLAKLGAAVRSVIRLVVGHMRSVWSQLLPRSMPPSPLLVHRSIGTPSTWPWNTRPAPATTNTAGPPATSLTVPTGHHEFKVRWAHAATYHTSVTGARSDYQWARPFIFWHFMLQSRWCGHTILTGPDHTDQERRIA